jgi:hypothetical protein
MNNPDESEQAAMTKWGNALRAQLQEYRENVNTVLTVSAVLAGLTTASFFALLTIKHSPVLSATLIALVATTTVFLVIIMHSIVLVITIAAIEGNLRWDHWVQEHYRKQHSSPQYVLGGVETQMYRCGAGFFLLAISIGIAGFLYSLVVGFVAAGCGLALAIYMIRLASLKIGETENLT